MKKLLIFALMLFALQASGQRNFNLVGITDASTYTLASEGDLYYDTANDLLYIGLFDGTLYLMEQDSQSLSLAGNTLSITRGNSVDLTPFVNTDNQDLSLAGNTLSLTNDGTPVDLTPFVNTDNQDLSLAGNTLSLTNDGTPVDLTPFVNTDNQDLSLAGNTLSLTNDGTPVDLTPFVNTDNQDLSLAGNTLSLTNDGTTVDLSPYLDNTDDQTLTYTNTDPDDNINTLQIEGSAAFNIDDNHLGTDNQTLDANRTVDLNGNNLTFDGTQDVIIEADGDVGIGTSTPGARLDVDNGSVKFSDYGVGTYLDTLTGAHPHSVFHLGVDSFGDVVEVNTVKSAKIFYPPSIVIDVGSVSANFAVPGDGGDESKDLYLEYFSRFNSPLVGSPNGPAAIPTYSRDELYYYVTDLDPTVFVNAAVDDSGNFTYDIASVPTGNCTWINVVFVVK